MFRSIFAVIAVLVFIGINTYAYRRFLRRIDLLQPFQKVLKWMMIVIVILEILFFVTLRFNTLTSDVFLAIASLIGISFMLFCTALVYDLFHLPLSKVPFDASRRLMIKTIFDITMLILAASYVFKGFINGFKLPAIKEVDVAIRGLKKPLCVAQISDVHIGQVLGKEYLQSIVKTINTLNADIVVITGDLVDTEVSKIGDALHPLMDIISKHGVYFVPGNHEYFHGVESILKYLESLHVKVLGNRHEQVAGLNLAGVYDLMGERMESSLIPDVDTALKDHNANLPTVLLAHQPKQVNTLRGDEPIDLILSGHTHGGQIFPFGLLVLLDQPYLHGLYQHSERTQIYVSSGAGFWGPPVRIMAPSEVVKLNLNPENV